MFKGRCTITVRAQLARSPDKPLSVNDERTIEACRNLLVGGVRQRLPHDVAATVRPVVQPEMWLLDVLQRLRLKIQLDLQQTFQLNLRMKVWM